MDKSSKELAPKKPQTDFPSPTAPLVPHQGTNRWAERLAGNSGRGGSGYPACRRLRRQASQNCSDFWSMPSTYGELSMTQPGRWQCTRL